MYFRFQMPLTTPMLSVALTANDEHTMRFARVSLIPMSRRLYSATNKFEQRVCSLQASCPPLNILLNFFNPVP
jgi:hypothetical protein